MSSLIIFCTPIIAPPHHRHFHLNIFYLFEKNFPDFYYYFIFAFSSCDEKRFYNFIKSEGKKKNQSVQKPKISTIKIIEKGKEKTKKNPESFPNFFTTSLGLYSPLAFISVVLRLNDGNISAAKVSENFD